jgi:hypothetical protein
MSHDQLRAWAQENRRHLERRLIQLKLNELKREASNQGEVAKETPIHNYAILDRIILCALTDIREQAYRTPVKGRRLITSRELPNAVKTVQAFLA